MINDNKKELISMIVPTGIGASIGGFAGDASYWARKFSEYFNVIVNPNVVNAACFSGIKENMLYCEGSAFDRFMKGEISLKPSRHNKIGVIFDKGISEGIRNVHINTMNAVKTVYGTDIIGYEISEEEAGVEFFNTKERISSGRVLNPQTLLKAGKKLLDRGAQALAVVCKFDEPPEDDYINGNDVDIVGGVEAIISHYLTSELMTPVVHAPAFENIEITKDIVSEKVAAEYITPTFLPCLLLGLENAPLIFEGIREEYIHRHQLKGVIMPYNSLGASCVLDSITAKIPVFAVEENKTILNVTSEVINKKNDIIKVPTYRNCLELLLKDYIYEKV
ncbi:DUF3326 domain-containing protein [bacterium]|nr:DUF3326 domain-containing protein [bacterium]